MPKRTQRSPTGSVRIIAGKWRRRQLRVQEPEGLRPTPDRVRETVFNWLSPHIAGARCLDVFAGSGALGFEALSRGAASAVFVDSGRVAQRLIQQNIAKLGATDRARIVSQDATPMRRSRTLVRRRAGR